MSTADHILDQIDHALHDWSVSDDAMRSQPVVEPQPKPFAFGGFTPTVQIMDEVGEWQEVGVTSVEIHIEPPTIDPAFHRSWEEFREHLVRAEAERVRLARAAIEAFGRAYAEVVKPAVEAAARSLAEFAEAVQHVDPPLPPGRRRDRPAWQSPYGPPRRRR